MEKRRIKTASTALSASLLVLGAGIARAANPKVALHKDSAPGSYHLEGAFTVSADPRVAWEVITDYDGIGRFVSAIRSSRVLRRDADGVLIEQVGSGGFLFISRQVALTLAVREAPPYHVDFKDTRQAEFLRYEGSWRIAPAQGGCAVSYELTADPDGALGPRFLAKGVLRRSVERLLGEVRTEMQRRAALESDHGRLGAALR